jgi:hypothetical protein
MRYSPRYSSALILPVLTVPVLGMAGCTTSVDTAPPRSASEELLISKAAEQAADALKLDIRPGTKLYVDTSYFAGTDAKDMDIKYAIGTIRDRLARQGARLVDKKTDAETVVELRSGALSIEQHEMLIGIPSFSVPVPLAGPMTMPELALYKHAVRAGVAKFAASEYDKDGALVASDDPQFGYSDKNQTVLLIVIGWNDGDIAPKGAPVEGSE